MRAAVAEGIREGVEARLRNLHLDVLKGTAEVVEGFSEAIAGLRAEVGALREELRGLREEARAAKTVPMVDVPSDGVILGAFRKRFE